MRQVCQISGRRVEEDLWGIARFCMAEIAKASELIAPLESGDPDTGRGMTPIELTRAALALKVDMMRQGQRYESQGPDAIDDGCYVPMEEECQIEGVIYLQRGINRVKFVKVATHELIHHVMRTRVSESFYGAECVLCYDLNGVVVRERICGMGEQIAWGLQ